MKKNSQKIKVGKPDTLVVPKTVAPVIKKATYHKRTPIAFFLTGNMDNKHYKTFQREAKKHGLKIALNYVYDSADARAYMDVAAVQECLVYLRDFPGMAQVFYEECMFDRTAVNHEWDGEKIVVTDDKGDEHTAGEWLDSIG